MADVRRGLIIVNTGPGKGKTTAAMGTGLRAVGGHLPDYRSPFLARFRHSGHVFGAVTGAADSLQSFPSGSVGQFLLRICESKKESCAYA